MQPAIIVVDMLEDFINLDGPLPVGEEGVKIIPNIQTLLKFCRLRAVPIVYSNDALMPDDFLFNSRMKPHGIKGTKGAQVIKELQPQHSDIIVPKPRFSGFFKTNLEGMLRELGVDTLVVCGVATEICVISTAYDAVCSDFKVIIIDDCCASRSKVVHDQLLEILRRSPLHPLLRVTSLNDFLRTV